MLINGGTRFDLFAFFDQRINNKGLASIQYLRTDHGVGAFALWELTYVIYYIGWEAHFRGFMLFVLAKRVGPTAAVLIQMIPSTLIHIAYPKPESETFTAIFVGGIVFGFLALRARSFLYLIALHWLAGGSFDLYSCLFG